MNYKRLQKLEETLGQLQKVYSNLESIRDEEQEDYESMPEFKRYSEFIRIRGCGRKCPPIFLILCCANTLV